MAGTDTRRSSRARTIQPPSHNSSSNSSTTSSRAERNTRSFNKTASPQKSTPTGSLSSEPLEDTITAEDPLATRRRTRSNGEDREKPPPPPPPPKPESVGMANEDEDLPEEEDEAVRCICGFDDYPGPPPLDDESKNSSKDAMDIDPIFSTDVNDDMAGFFVQCDICKVWQHGACVGIMTEESSPDEYFCEQCRKDMHKIFTARNGQRYSHYSPVKRQSRAASRAGSQNKDGTKSPKEKDAKESKEIRNARNSSAAQAAKRRSTMNSREAAYDEAEALRRAIEASREEALHDHEGPTRRPKRGRSDSEERKQENTKRRRTSTRSLSPAPPTQGADDSDDALSHSRNPSSKPKPSKNGTTTRNQRNEKVPEKEDRDRQRSDAGNKRKARAERRRADGILPTSTGPANAKIPEAHNMDTDSDPSEEMPLAARTSATRTLGTNPNPAPNSAQPPQEPAPPQPAEPRPPSSRPSPDTPPAANPPPPKADKKRSHKKKGRNQYTKDRDDDGSPARSQSRDLQREEGGGGTNSKGGGSGGGGEGGGGGGGKSGSRNKGGMNSKITMTDLRRKATALLDFISRTQVDLAGETPSGTESGEEKPNAESGLPSSSSSASGEQHKQQAVEQLAAGGDRPATTGQNGEVNQTKDFKELNCMEMMDSLTRRLVKWQQEYAA